MNDPNRRAWTAKLVVAAVRALARGKKANVGYRAVQRADPALLAAGRRLFGSWAAALRAARVDQERACPDAPWTKRRVILLVKRARRRGEALDWSSVRARGDALGRAAQAAVRARLFGSWERALQAAGVDADEHRRRRRWDRALVLFELRAWAAEGHALGSGAMRADDPALHAAAARRFGCWGNAVRAVRRARAGARRTRV